MIGKLFGWVKMIPHPEYGNYGGWYKRCKNKKSGQCPKPVDKLDEAYRDHDNGLKNWALVKRLWGIHPWDMKRPVYGTFHKYLVMAAFSIASAVGVQ